MAFRNHCLKDLNFRNNIWRIHVRIIHLWFSYDSNDKITSQNLLLIDEEVKAQF